MSGSGTSWRLGVEPSESVLDWLQSQLSVEEDVSVVRRCGGGVGASTHLLRSGDLQVVLKQYPTERAEAVQREWDGLQLASANGLPVPIPLAVDIDGVDVGLPTIAMSFASGLPDLRARDTEVFAAEVADLLARLHRVGPESVSAKLRVSDRVDRWETPEPIPDGLLPPGLVGDVVARITDLASAAEPEEAVINHGDMHPGNLLWEDGRVSALLDWSHLRVGTRSAELAYFRIELAVLAGWSAAETLAEKYQQRAEVTLRNQTLRDLLHVYAGHCWAHTWLEGWHEQERTDLSLTDVSSALSETARILLDR